MIKTAMCTLVLTFKMFGSELELDKNQNFFTTPLLTLQINLSDFPTPLQHPKFKIDISSLLKQNVINFTPKERKWGDPSER